MDRGHTTSPKGEILLLTPSGFALLLPDVSESVLGGQERTPTEEPPSAKFASGKEEHLLFLGAESFSSFWLWVTKASAGSSGFLVEIESWTTF